MSRIRLAVGNVLYKGTRKLEVLKHIDLKTALMKDLETGKREVLSISQLKTQAQVSEGGLSENIFHQGATSDEHWAVAKRRYEIVKPLLNQRWSPSFGQFWGRNKVEPTVTHAASVAAAYPGRGRLKYAS